MFILDTNVISELRKAGKGTADANVIAWAIGIPVVKLYLSAVTIHELELGVLLVERRDVIKGAVLRKWLSHYVLPAFANRILPIDTAVARQSAALQVPQTRPFRDGLIAATGIVHRMTIVTRNIADFSPTGAALLNPWD